MHFMTDTRWQTLHLKFGSYTLVPDSEQLLKLIVQI